MGDHPNAQFIRRGLEAFSKGDMATVGGLFGDDIVFHVPGNSPISGEYKGKDEVFGFLAQLPVLTDGSFRLDVHDVVGNDEHVVALVRGSGSRPDGRTLDMPIAQVFHVRDGKAVEFWGMAEDQAKADAFWS
jgi:ketosteroid isomerase-like protein